MTIFERSKTMPALDGNVVPDMAGAASSTAMYRYKTIIGQRLHVRILSNQKTEAKIACNILNRVTSLGMPISVRIT